MKKYELIKDDYKELPDGTKLYRINALRDFFYVKKGDLGGYIEKEDNLSHDGNSWVFDTAEVYGNAEVCGDACVYGNARVFGYASVFGNSRISENTVLNPSEITYYLDEILPKVKYVPNCKIFRELYPESQVVGNFIKVYV